MGILRYTPSDSTTSDTPEVFVFNKHDGLQSNEFDAGGAYRSSLGELFFTGERGINKFFSENIRINRYVPEIRIARVTLDGASLPRAQSEFDISRNFHIPYHFQELRLELAVLDYTNPVKNRMQYRLSTQGEWIELDSFILSLRGLPDGEHTFQFRGSNNDGVWSNNLETIIVTVNPPLIRSPWMITLYVIFLIGIPWLHFQRRQTRMLAAQRHLEDKVAARTHQLERANASRERLFANLSHEISSPVHMLLLLLESNLNKERAKDVRLYKSATGYAAQLMVFLKQLVSEARALEMDSRIYATRLARTIELLVATNRAIAVAHSISLEVGELPLDRVTVYKHSSVSIFSNLLFNALVYTPKGGTINIEGRIDDDFYELCISNTVERDQTKDIKNFFERGVKAEVSNAYFGGHGLGLSIVSSAVSVLGGEIKFGVRGQETIFFSVRLPLAQNAVPDLPRKEDLEFSKEQLLAITNVSRNTSEEITAIQLANPISILLVEDDLMAANLLHQSLSKSFRVRSVNTCKEAILSARKNQYDVIICDLHLPDCSGFEVLKEIRTNRMTMDSFFILITGSFSDSEQLEGQSQGVDQYVTKPVSAEMIKLLIKNQFTLIQQRAGNKKKEKLIRLAKMDDINEIAIPFEQRFSDVLEEMHSESGINIGDIHLRMAMSYTSLVKNCKKSFGKTPKRLLIEKRVSVAKGLLVSTKKSASIISEQVGFSSQSQFAIVFKKETGMTATSYRSKHKKLRS